MKKFQKDMKAVAKEEARRCVDENTNRIVPVNVSPGRTTSDTVCSGRTAKPHNTFTSIHFNMGDNTTFK